MIPIAIARAEFLRLMIPQLTLGGFSCTAAKYAAELATLEGRTVEEVAAVQGHQPGSDGTTCLFCAVQL